MTGLIRAMNAETTVTENGMSTYQSSRHPLVDLFFKWGGSRGKFDEEILPTLAAAAATDLNLTLSLLLWGRDVRGGAGERELFRRSVHYLIENGYDIPDTFFHKIVEVGRWDDIVFLLNTRFQHIAIKMIQQGINNENTCGLVAKWLPREKKNPALAKKIYEFLDWTPRQYRKTLVRLSNVVETKMCANEWKDIEYGHVPSLAAARYQKAFSRHDEAGYSAYREGLKKGTEKVNSSAVYPYDVVKSLAYGDKDVAEAQWAALPNYLADDHSNTLVVADVSGSMSAPVGGNNTISCMDVCSSLAMYLSERNRGLFRDTFITFSGNPQLQVLKGRLRDRFNQLRRADWGMNTDIQKVFDLILDSAVKHGVGSDEMPTRIVILSDMQFDQATGQSSIGWYRQTKTKTTNEKAIELAERKYREAGYTRPQIVFWNLRTSSGVPVEFDKNGTALVSGFSPSIMKSILSATKFTPFDIMMETIGSDRYKV